MGFQQVVILGNVGKEPEMRYTANGNAVCTFSVAVNEAYTDAAGTKHEQVEWFSCVAWNKTAELVGQYVTRGKELLLTGTMRTRSWDDQNGAKKYRTELIVRDMKFVGKAERRDNGPDDIDPDDLPFSD